MLKTTLTVYLRSKAHEEIIKVQAKFKMSKSLRYSKLTKLQYQTR